MLLLLDNYDSFTYNLYQFLCDLGVEAIVRRNDVAEVEGLLSPTPRAIVLSPGPCTPRQAGHLVPLVTAASTRKIPTLGVCLGHQAIAEAHGGQVKVSSRQVHGKVAEIHHNSTGLFTALPSPLVATRYHSLTVETQTLPNCFSVTAQTNDADETIIMGLAHKTLPLWGVQFHPESIASEAGHELLGNFLSLAFGKVSVAESAA